MAIKEKIMAYIAAIDELRYPSNTQLTYEDQQSEVGSVVFEELTVGALEKQIKAAKYN